MILMHRETEVCCTETPFCSVMMVLGKHFIATERGG